ncbi:MAG: hypothetical protein HQL52_14475 [Magnetococcales bacterium]|nr:hypothetical protein [Magnetococcales bacterium]
MPLEGNTPELSTITIQPVAKPTMIRFLKENYDRLLFFFALLFMAFGYGVATVTFEIFPYSVLKAARASLEAVQSITIDVKPEIAVRFDLPETEGYTRPTVSSFSKKQGQELILVGAVTFGQLPEHCPEYGCIAWLMDRDGEIKYTWKYSPELWADVTKISGSFLGDNFYPIAFHLFDNGDLLVSFQGKDSWPYGVGMARFDKHSKLLWKQEILTHHWFSVDAAGRIHTPSFEIVESPVAIGKTSTDIECEQVRFSISTIKILGPDGEIEEEIPILDAFADSGYEGVLFSPGENLLEVHSCDPFHLNDVRLLPPEMADNYPGLEAGDLLLSLRSINGVAVYSPKHQKMQWVSVGTTIKQHAPRFDGEGGIYIFDNLGGDKEIAKGTRIVRLDLESRVQKTIFPRPGVTLPGKGRGHAAHSGHIELSRDGKRLLAAYTGQGVLWEIDIESAEVLWEFINTHPFQDRASRLSIYTAKYVYPEQFPFR